MAPTAPKKQQKKIQAAPFKASTKVRKADKGCSYFEKSPRNFRLGGDVRPRTDMSRFVRWPKYIRLQRQRKILLERLKVPPALNQFNCPIDKNQSNQLFRLLDKYKPETRVEKKARLVDMATNEKAAAAPAKKPLMLKYGLNHVADLVELKRARLVVIAHDVEPVELVCWLPALCRTKDIPYCIVKNKAKLGQLVHKKTASAVVIENVRKEDQNELDLLCQAFRAQFNDNMELRRRWGGGMLGTKSQHQVQKKEKMIALEASKKMVA